MKSKWTHLTSDDMKEALAQDEIDKLQQMSVSADDIMQKQLDSVADSFRASFSAKGYTIDVRDHYIPSSYRLQVIALARWYIWTRFPNSKDIALDEPRQKLYEDALALLKDPYLGVDEPDYSDVPELSSQQAGMQDSCSVKLPFQRILPQPFGFGFEWPYIAQWGNLS